MPEVIITQSSYEYDRLRADVFSILGRLDGGRIELGTDVLIKPNFLAPSTPEQALTSHPLVIRATAEYALERGARVRVSDSPPMGSFERIIRKCGIREALDGLKVDIRELGESRPVTLGGRWKTIELAGDALDADVIINLPKLKSHCQMGLTLAVKNLFGCVVGMRKAQWHYRVGENRELFAELLVEIYDRIRPAMNLMDGIMCLEGDGPGAGGTPRHIGVLMGSTDALPIDVAICQMLGMRPAGLLTNHAAERKGLPLDCTISGSLPEVRGFMIPETRDLLFGPRFTHKFMRRHVTVRPRNIAGACKLCNECLRMCPAKAITSTGEALEFDYEKCIRCYCCLEICPHKAIERHEPGLTRLAKALIPRRKISHCKGK